MRPTPSSPNSHKNNGVYGKQQNAPGFQKVAAPNAKGGKTSRQSTLATLGLWKNWSRAYKLRAGSARRALEKLARIPQTCLVQQEKKWTYVSMNAEERLYCRTHQVGNGMDDVEDYHDVIQVPSWTYESRCVLEDLLSEKRKPLSHQLYKEEKRENMENEDTKPRNKTQKKVSFA